MAINAPPAGADKAALPSPRRSGIRIKHWLLIVVFAAFVVDIGMRAGLFRRLTKPSAADLAAQRQLEVLAAQRYLETGIADSHATLDDATRSLNERLKNLKKDSLEREKLGEDFRNDPPPPDPWRGNIIQL